MINLPTSVYVFSLIKINPPAFLLSIKHLIYMRRHTDNFFGEIGSAIGKGLIAGVVGTAAITLSQMIEMSITKRKPSEAPLKVAKKVTNIKPANKEVKETVAQQIHWAYGTSWGVARGIIGLTGVKGLPAALIHFAAIW